MFCRRHPYSTWSEFVLDKSQSAFLWTGAGGSWAAYHFSIWYALWIASFTRGSKFSIEFRWPY